MHLAERLSIPDRPCEGRRFYSTMRINAPLLPSFCRRRLSETRVRRKSLEENGTHEEPPNDAADVGAGACYTNNGRTVCPVWPDC